MCQVFVTLSTFTSWDFTLPFVLSFIFKAGPISSFQLNFCSDSDNKVLEIGHKLKYYEYSLYQHLVFMTQ